MKILLMTAAMDAGGAETHIFCLAKELAGMGEEVWVASSGGRLSEKLAQVGVRHFTLEVSRSSPISLARGRKKLSSLISAERFDLIHAHSRISAFLVCPLAEKYGIPFITTVHAKFSLSHIYRRLSRWGDITIAVSEDLRQYLCESYGISSENTRVIENGIDTSVFRPTASLPTRKRIVFISRLDRDCSSAAAALCRIGERLYSRFFGLEIVICGGGEMLWDIRAMARAACNKAGASFISVVGHVEDTAQILSEAAVFVGVSRAALEALSCGVPTVLFGDEGAMGLMDSEDRLCQAELSNFCCRGEGPADDETLFSELCRALSMTDKERAELSHISSEFIKSRHTCKVMADKTLSVYKEAIKEKPKSGRVVLCGYYGYGNMGDNALLRASIRRAERAFLGRDISALTAGGRKDGKDFGVRCVKRMSPLSVISELRGAEVLVLGGGTLLQDRTSLRSLAYYASVCEVASLLGVRIELWGNGLAPPHSHIAARLMTRALNKATYIGLRDESSVIEALRLVAPEVGDRLYLEQDLAAKQKEAEPLRVRFLQKLFGLWKNGRLAEYAVIAVKGGEGRGFIEILEQKLSELAEMGLSLVFLPMFPREDRAVCQRLASAFNGRVAEGLSESDAVGLMKDSQVVCGMRLHALVFASAADVPFVGFGGDPKIQSFCRENGGAYFTDII